METGTVLLKDGRGHRSSRRPALQGRDAQAQPLPPGLAPGLPTSKARPAASRRSPPRDPPLPSPTLTTWSSRPRHSRVAKGSPLSIRSRTRRGHLASHPRARSRLSHTQQEAPGRQGGARGRPGTHVAAVATTPVSSAGGACPRPAAEKTPQPVWRGHRAGHRTRRGPLVSEPKDSVTGHRCQDGKILFKKWL